MKRRGSEVIVGITLLVGAFGIVHADSDDWPMYGRTPHHSFARTDSVITAANAGLLQSAWTFTPGDAVTASPTVVGGVVYVGSWDGFFYTLDARTGAVRWATNVVFGGSAGGFIGTAAFDGKRIYGGTGYGDLGGAICMPSNPADQPIEDPSFHAFDLRTGAVDWEQTFHYTFGASTVANGVVLNGWAGLGSFAPSALTAFDSATGNIVGYWPQPGSLNSGVTISGKMIFFGTGNSFDGAGSTISAMALP